MAPMLVGGFLALASASASADDGWYAAFDYGNSNLGSVPARADSGAHGYHLTAGYAPDRYFALEGGYLDFGKVDTGSDIYFGVISPGFSVTTKAHGFTFDLVGTLPLGDRFSLSARAGVITADVQVDWPASSFSPTGGSRSKNSTRFGAGFGAAYKISDTWSAYCQWVQYDSIDGPIAGEGNFNLGSIGLKYSFH